jgi:hypothetical protein
MAAETPASPPAPLAPVPLPAPPAAEPTEEKPPPCPKLGWVDACAPPEPRGGGPRLSADEVETWCGRRGAKPPKDYRGIDCYPVRIGPEGEEALACARVRQPSAASAANGGHVFRLAADWFVIAVRARRVETLVSIPYVVDVLDKETAGIGPLFAMGVVLDAGGQRIAVMEPGENACAQAKAKLAGSVKEAAANADAHARRGTTDWGRFDAKLLDGICKQPRVWIYKQGRFRPPVAGVVSSRSSGSISTGL